jgi:hypothetical protein
MEERQIPFYSNFLLGVIAIANTTQLNSGTLTLILLMWRIG